MSDMEEAAPNDLEARRARLLALKEKGASRGLSLKPQAPALTPHPAPNKQGEAGEGQNSPFSGDRSKYFASFMLNTLRAKPEGEQDPRVVPGTVFTEFGLKKLLEGLRERSELMGAQGKGVMKRFYDFLTSPPTTGQQIACGVNLEHLERFVNFLAKMQMTGWDGVQKDFMSGSGKELLESFSKPRIEVLETEILALKQLVSTLSADVAVLKAKV